LISSKRSDHPTVARGSIRSREERVVARSKPEPRYEVFRRTKGDLVRVCVVEVEKPLPAFIQTGPWRLERSASRAELDRVPWRGVAGEGHHDPRHGRAGQAATAGRLTNGSSLIGAIVSRVM